MRLDHIAYRVSDRNKAVNFFKEALGYIEQTVFDLKFDDGTTCECTALEPPEKPQENPEKRKTIEEQNKIMGLSFSTANQSIPWTFSAQIHSCGWGYPSEKWSVPYHLAPEIFVSEGQPGSIVEQWVNERNGIGGIHHLAYQVESVKDTMKEWKEKGYAEFLSEEPLTCPGLTQVFTKPSELTGVIYEFINRGKHGFCTDNVKSLMESTVVQS